MSYEWYVTPEQYRIAEQNGISKQVLEKRIRGYAWDKARALTTPIRPRRDFTDYREIAIKNGIPLKTFQGRIKRKWDPIRAATIPVISHSESLNKQWEINRKYPKEVVQRAENNGISYRTFQWRMSHGWSLKDASETKILTTTETIARAKQASPWSKEKRMVGMR